MIAFQDFGSFMDEGGERGDVILPFVESRIHETLSGGIDNVPSGFEFAQELVFFCRGDMERAGARADERQQLFRHQIVSLLVKGVGQAVAQAQTEHGRLFRNSGSYFYRGSSPDFITIKRTLGNVVC